LEYYSVELMSNDGAVDEASIRTIEAASPLRAAEEAVGRPLSLHGNRPCAIVRWMNTAYVAFTVTIYDQPPTAVERSPSK
jgi:hypothetical protein